MFKRRKGLPEMGSPTKDPPIEGYEDYEITKEQWSEFRMETWGKFLEAFVVKPRRELSLVVNNDANGTVESEWITQNFKYIGIKNGMFSHGWHISNSQQRRSEWMERVRVIGLQDKQTFVRGEEDREMFIYGQMTKNIPRGLYVSAQFGLYNGLDLWNIPSQALTKPENQPGFAFFNKYAGHRDSRTAPAAFCSLRQGLDASNTQKFPESQFGAADSGNIARYTQIAEAYADYGAIQGDPGKAASKIGMIKDGMMNRKRMDYNDVAWGIHEGNYWRFLEQHAADETSIGWWHQGPEDSIYSHFSRSFRIKDGQAAMYFKLDPYFIEKGKVADLSLRVVYLDRGQGQ